MASHLRFATASGGALALAALAGSAFAGGCNCIMPAPPPPPPPVVSTCCNVPNTHQVIVPGVQITAPQITITAPQLNVAEAQANASAVANANANASSSANTTVNVSTNSTVNNAAAAIISTGGGSAYSLEQNNASYIPALAVESNAPAPTPPVCVSYSSLIKAVAIEAQCLDDKAVPHPASQVSPDRDVADTYEGEVYRCIAGARMQYTIAEYRGQADFNRGQTVVCRKGEALYHTAAGALQCRAQRAARDCNERSLLRRFGAGIKVMKLSQASVCTRYTGGQQTAATGSDGAIVLDGGVGGIVR